MTERIQFKNRPGGNEEPELREAASGGSEPDTKLDQALAEFRLSVHAWSEAAYTRARIADSPMNRRSWRLAAGWVLGCALVAGGVTGGIVEHQRQQTARIAVAAEQQAQQQVATAQEQAQSRNRIEDPSLMTKVDSDTAQEVPDAMQPLAQLMEDGGNE